MANVPGASESSASASRSAAVYVPALWGCIPAVEYTLGNTAASSAPLCESSTSVPTFTTAPTPASAALFTASSGETSSRNRCVCESTSIAPIPSSPESSAKSIIKGLQVSGIRFQGTAAEATSVLYQPPVDLTALHPRLPGRPRGGPRRSLSCGHVVSRPPYNVVHAFFVLRCSAADHEHDLTFRSPGEVPCRHFGRSPENLLVELGELPANGDRGCSGKIAQRLREPVRGLEEHEGGCFAGDTPQQVRARSSFARRKAGEDDGISGQSRGNEGRGEGRGSRQGFYRDAGLDAGVHEPVAGVGDEWGAGVGDESHVLGFGPFGELGGETLFVVFVVGGEVLLYLVVSEETAGASRVLAGDEVGLAQVPQGAQGNVLQVAYRGGDHGEGHPSVPQQVLSRGGVPGEGGGAEDAGLGAEGGDLDLGVVARRGPGAEDHLPAGRFQNKFSRLHRASADGDHLGVEDVHEGGEADAEPPPGLVEHRERHLVPPTGQIRNVFAQDLTPGGQAPEGRVRVFDREFAGTACYGRA